MLLKISKLSSFFLIKQKSIMIFKLQKNEKQKSKKYLFMRMRLAVRKKMLIKHDFHIHTNLSLCADKSASLDMYVSKAKELSLDKIAITNHVWDNTVCKWEHIEDGKREFYTVQNVDYILTAKDEIKKYYSDDLEILFGCEAEYCFEKRKPAISVEAAEQMDVLLVPNSHTHLAMPKSFYEPHKKHIEFMVEAFMNTVNSDVAKYVTAIPHPFMAVACPYDNRTLLNEITDDDFKRCFDAAAQKGIALELNPNFLKSKSLKEAYNDLIFRMYRIGKECGCKFTVGTDAHSEKGYDNFEKIYIMTSLLELTTEDFHPSTR